MKCLSCNAEIKENAKFCTKCGSPIKPQSSKNNNKSLCCNCNAPLKEDAKFCVTCGTPVKSEAEPVSQIDNTNHSTPMSSVKGMIYWEVQQGEIARRINEAEFIQYDSATGVIVNDGTTAYIKSDGVKVAELQGGVYNFIDPKELDEILETRVGGLVGGIKKGFKGVMNFILGRKVKDKVADSNDVYNQDSLDKIVECMQQDKVLSLTLKLDKDFELLFGECHNNIDGYSQFKPMTIRTKYLDVQMGVRATFKISDFSKFASHYLADRNSVSAAYLADIITPLVKEATQRVMSDIELSSHSITPDVYEILKSVIIAKVNESLQGISMSGVTEITVEDKDLERLRTLSRELYLSEKELDYLIRTNDFKNRLNVQIDQQDLYDARRNVDKEGKLREINKDDLLSIEEFNKFNEVLELERAIRSANSEEELEKLKDDIASRKFDREFAMFEREHAMNIRQQHAVGEVEQIELERLRKVRLSTARTDVDEQQIRDDYQFTVENRKIEQDEKQALSAMERLKMLKEIEREEEDNALRRELERTAVSNEHELNLKKTDISKIDAQSNLSPDQLMAIAANENMSPEAAIKFAESFSEKYKGAASEEQKRELLSLYQERINDKDRDSDRMERLMREMMQTATNIAGTSAQNSETLKSEYKERLERQEDRMDNTQDRALDYTTKNNAIQKQQQVAQDSTMQQSYYLVDIEGKENVQLQLPQLILMIRKGIVKADTYVFSSTIQDWGVASKIKEIAHLF